MRHSIQKKQTLRYYTWKETAMNFLRKMIQEQELHIKDWLCMI